MAAFFDPSARSRAPVTDDIICALLEDLNNSEIKDLDEDDLEFDPDTLFRETEEGNVSEEEHDADVIVERALLSLSPPPPPPLLILTPRAPDRSSRRSRRRRSVSASRLASSERSRSTVSTCHQSQEVEGNEYGSSLYFKINHTTRLPMYWRAGTKLGLACEVISRDRFLTLRNALRVVDSEFPPETENGNPLWKVQPMIDKVKEPCNKLERVPGFYSIDEQMIPFTGRCKLRQVVKNKPRPVGLKNFVLTTSEGLMLDFDIYKGARSTFGDSTLGLGPSVILHLSKSIPPGSCIYHDRYFTTVPLVEEMEKLNLHSTGTIMQNRIPARATIKFNKDLEMNRGESQQFVCKPTTIVKWKDNKSVLLVSNYTGAEETSYVKRWDKKHKMYVDVSAPKIHKEDITNTWGESMYLINRWSTIERLSKPRSGP